MFAPHQTEIDIVRRRLDTLGVLRSSTGLTPTEGRQYQELCASEQRLLSLGHRDVDTHRARFLHAASESSLITSPRHRPSFL